MADVWVKYRNKKSGAEGVCKYTDYKSAIKRTDKLTIVEKYEGRPGGGGKVIENIKASDKHKRKETKKAPVKEPEAAKEAKKNADEKSKSNNSKE